MAKDVGFTTMGDVSEGGDAPEIGIGMIGYAFMGKAHSNGYKTIPSMMYPPPAIPVLKSIAGRNAEAVAAAAKRFGWERSTTDWRDLLDRPRCADAVVIATQDAMHVEPTLAALAAGKHVICEKPLGRNPAESKQMWDAAEAAGLKHMAAFNYRFVPAIIQARKLVKDGVIGEVFHFRARYAQEWIIDPNFPLIWRLDKDVSGSGVLGDLGSHTLDLARFIVGEITAVNGRLKTFIKERPTAEDPSVRGPVTVDDAYMALLEFENGAIGSVEATRFGNGRKNGNTFEINGSLGSISYNMEQFNELEVYIADTEPAEANGFRKVLVTEAFHPYWENWWPHGHIIGWEHTFVHELHHLLDCIVNDKDVAPMGATFEDGYKCDTILAAIAESDANGGARVEISC